MVIYTLDGKSHKIDTSNEINSGGYGNIYLVFGNKCLKLFKKPVLRSDDMTFDENVYNVIRKLELKNFYKQHDLFYNRGLTKILGYVSDYYENEDIDIMTMPVDYTLNALCNLYDSLVKLSDNNICAEDLHRENVITNERDITIIDTDLYYKSDEDKSLIKKYNIYHLINLFKQLYYKSNSKHSEIDTLTLCRRIDALFSVSKNYSVDPVVRRLIRYKYPIDYLKKSR